MGYIQEIVRMFGDEEIAIKDSSGSKIIEFLYRDKKFSYKFFLKIHERDKKAELSYRLVSSDLTSFDIPDINRTYKKVHENIREALKKYRIELF